MSYGSMQILQFLTRLQRQFKTGNCRNFLAQVDQPTMKLMNLGDMTYNSLLQNITKCNYLNVSYLDLPDRNLTENSQQTLNLLLVNIRYINNFQNFEAFEEFLTDLLFSPDIVCECET